MLNASQNPKTFIAHIQYKEIRKYVAGEKSMLDRNRLEGVSIGQVALSEKVLVHRL